MFISLDLLVHSPPGSGPGDSLGLDFPKRHSPALPADEGEYPAVLGYEPLPTARIHLEFREVASLSLDNHFTISFIFISLTYTIIIMGHICTKEAEADVATKKVKNHKKRYIHSSVDIMEVYTFGKLLGTGSFGSVRVGYPKNNPSLSYAIKSIGI